MYSELGAEFPIPTSAFSPGKCVSYKCSGADRYLGLVEVVLLQAVCAQQEENYPLDLSSSLPWPCPSSQGSKGRGALALG